MNTAPTPPPTISEKLRDLADELNTELPTLASYDDIERCALMVRELRFRAGLSETGLPDHRPQIIVDAARLLAQLRADAQHHAHASHLPERQLLSRRLLRVSRALANERERTADLSDRGRYYYAAKLLATHATAALTAPDTTKAQGILEAGVTLLHIIRDTHRTQPAARRIA